MTRRVRRAALAAFIAGCSTLPSNGCVAGGFSLSSLNPFKKSTETAAVEPAPSTGVTGKFAAMRQSATGQVNSMGMATKNAFTKTKNSVTGLFTGKKEKTEPTLAADDPTRLDSPASVGPDVYVAQGQLWETTGDFPKAMQSYNRALETEPNNAAALASIARLHFRQENFPAAADFFRKALVQSPNEASLHNDYGLTQAKLGDNAGAIQSISKALTLAPGTSRYANNLADAKYNSGDLQGSLAVLMQHNKPAVAHFNMAYLHYKSGRYAEAKTHLTEVVKYEPQAAGDTAVSKAVSRSREMLASIDAPASRIAQAAPQAYAAAQQFAGAVQQMQQPVQQTAQVGSPVASPATQAAATAPTSVPGYAWTPPTTTQPQVPATSPAVPGPTMTPGMTPGAVAPVAPASVAPAPGAVSTPTAATPQTPYTLPPNFFNQ